MRIRPLQNRVENQIPLIPSIVPKRIFVEVRLQVLSGMRGRDNDEKTPVFGMVERCGKGRMMAFVTPDVHVCFGQQRANLAEHPPSGFVGHSGFTLNLLCRDAATSRAIRYMAWYQRRSDGLLCSKIVPAIGEI
jgi:hypothetical protein